MKSVDEHLKEALDAVEPLAAFDMQLLEAHDTLLAQDVVATRDLPRFDNSAMDGYAVRAADLVGASYERPVTLPVVGDIAAGRTDDDDPSRLHRAHHDRCAVARRLRCGRAAGVDRSRHRSVQIRRRPRSDSTSGAAGEDVEAGA